MRSAAERTIVWRGRRVSAMVPHPLATQSLTLSESVNNRCTSAGLRLSVVAEMVPADFVSLTHLMARGEALASSHIEGITAPSIDSLLPRGSHVGRSLGDAVATVTFVRESAEGDLSMAMLCEWHARLMHATPLAPEHHGRLRTEQGWIGGSTPLDAALVTPPPDAVAPLMGDLLSFVNRNDLDPILQAAVAHAQFELVHPFADGNGRVGRLLIDWILARRLNLVAPPSISSVIALDMGGYLSGLALFRTGNLDAWISWFSAVVNRASQRQIALVQSVDELKARWRAQLLVRTDSSAWSILGLLPRHLLIDARIVASDLGVSPRTALTALETLAAAGILEEHSRITGKGRPSRAFVAPELLALVDVG